MPRILNITDGDDTMAVTSARNADWLKEDLTNTYDIKFKKVGCDGAKILNESVRFTKSGLKLEGDARHVRIARELSEEWIAARGLGLTPFGAARAEGDKRESKSVHRIRSDFVLSIGRAVQFFGVGVARHRQCERH